MQDKDMVNDILSQLNGSLTIYQNAIAQSSNGQLRQTLTTIRNNNETFQYDLYKLAEQKGYYKPAGPADNNEVSTIKDMFSKS